MLALFDAHLTHLSDLLNIVNPIAFNDPFPLLILIDVVCAMPDTDSRSILTTCLMNIGRNYFLYFCKCYYDKQCTLRLKHYAPLFQPESHAMVSAVKETALVNIQATLRDTIIQVAVDTRRHAETEQLIQQISGLLQPRQQPQTTTRPTMS